MADAAQIQAFLQSFFAAPENEISVAALTEGAGPWGAFAPMTGRLQDRRSALLPRLREEKLIFYGVAFDDASLRQLREDLLAFVGPSWSTFRGHSEPLNQQDPLETAMAQQFGGRVIKFRSNEQSRAPLSAAVMRMLRVWASRPRIRADLPRSDASVLRDFHMALQVGNAPAARQHLDTLRASGALTPLNLAFLQLQMLAALGRATEFLDDPALPEVLLARPRPPVVTEALIQAIYDRHMASFERNRDAVGALRAFRDRVLFPFGPLLISHRGMRRPTTVKLFAMVAVTSSPPQLSLLTELLTAQLSQEDRAWVQMLAGLMTPEPSPPAVEATTHTPAPPSPPAAIIEADALVRAREALEEGDVATAFQLALGALASPQRAAVLCQSAFELDTIEARRAALDAVDALEHAAREKFLKSKINLQVYESLRAALAAPASAAPTDLLQWVDQLNAGTLVDPPGAAMRGATEWDIRKLAESPGTAARLIAAMRAERNTEAEQALANSLPHLLAFFQSDDHWPRREFGSVYSYLTDTLYLATNGNGDDFDAFSTLLAAELKLGPSLATYQDRLSIAVELCDKFGAPANFDRLLDLLDVVISNISPPGDAAAAKRVELATTVAEKFRAQARRIRPTQRELLQCYFQDLGLLDTIQDLIAPSPSSANAEPSEAPDAWLSLQGLSIGIYSLHEQATVRVKQFLEKHVPNVQVKLNAAKVCTTQLQDLARSCDLVVMVTWASKHAATGCIQDYRPKHLPLLIPTHRGSSSILASLYEYATGVT